MRRLSLVFLLGYSATNTIAKKATSNNGDNKPLHNKLDGPFLLQGSPERIASLHDNIFKKEADLCEGAAILASSYFKNHFFESLPMHHIPLHRHATNSRERRGLSSWKLEAPDTRSALSSDCASAAHHTSYASNDCAGAAHHTSYASND